MKNHTPRPPQLLQTLEQSNPPARANPRRRRADRHPRRISPRGRSRDAPSHREGIPTRVRSSARAPDDGAADTPKPDPRGTRI